MPIPTISQRKHVRIVPEEPHEPTSTIVLTSYTSHYVDVRILKSALANNDGGGGPSALSDPDGQIIEWAFAGKTHTREITNQKTSSAGGGGGGGGGEEEAGPCKHSVWEHWIDSKATMTTPPPPDEGDMYTLANGDVLERGKQTDPITRKEWEYEELWTDLKIESIPGERNALLKEGEKEEEEEEVELRVSVVIKAENVHGEIIGLIVRVGGWVQGVLRSSNGTLEVERWCWKKRDKEEEEEEEGKGKGAWKCVFRVGYNGIMPCHMTFGEALGSLNEGQGLPGSGGMWTVVEIFRW